MRVLTKQLKELSASRSRLRKHGELVAKYEHWQLDNCRNGFRPETLICDMRLFLFHRIYRRSGNWQWSRSNGRNVCFAKILALDFFADRFAAESWYLYLFSCPYIHMMHMLGCIDKSLYAETSPEESGRWASLFLSVICTTCSPSLALAYCVFELNSCCSADLRTLFSHGGEGSTRLVLWMIACVMTRRGYTKR